MGGWRDGEMERCGGAVEHGKCPHLMEPARLHWVTYQAIARRGWVPG